MHHALYPYQEDGVDFLVNHTRGMLADDCGLGKTLQTIRAADREHVEMILVVCMTVGKQMWGRAFSDQQQLYRPVKILKDADDTVCRGVNIISYDALSLSSKINRYGLAIGRWPLVVLDEAHMLKNFTANRTKMIYGPGLAVCTHADRVWALTGTPMPNHAGELYPHLLTLHPEALKRHNGETMSQTQFEDVYCKVSHGPYGRTISGSKNLHELAAKIQPMFLRRKKKDVLKDLPPMLFVTEPLTVDPNDINLQSAVLSIGRGLYEGIAFTDLANLPISSERRALGLYKAPYVADLIDSELRDTHEKRIVFCHHRDVIHYLQERLLEYIPAVIVGGMSGVEMDRQAQLFQNDPKCRLFIGQIQAAGTTIDLTAASNVIMAEGSFVPKDDYQAASRAHRIGQKDGVLVRYLHVPDTLDEKIFKAMARKANDAALLFD